MKKLEQKAPIESKSVKEIEKREKEQKVCIVLLMLFPEIVKANQNIFKFYGDFYLIHAAVFYKLPKPIPQLY